MLHPDSPPTAEATAEAPPPEDAAGAAATIGPRIWGVIDVIRAERIAGWAIDRSDSAAALEIDIHREGRRIATVRADRPRPDLEKGGVGTGRYGFAAEIAPPLEPGFAFTLSATARAPDGAQAVLKPAGPEGAAAAPERRILERVFEETVALRQALARQKPEHARPPADADRLRETIERIELAQARLEAAMTAIEPAPAPRADLGLRIILGVTAAIAVASLGFGLQSFWQP